MSNASLPRAAERLLEALGAETEFRDAVIGDLAEEHALRVRWDGPAAARRWYYRETMRVAPYLLRDWVRGLRRRDVGYFAKVLVWTTLSTIAVESIVSGIVNRFGLLRHSHPAAMVMWTLADGVFAGYLAARLGRRAPLPGAFLVGTTLVGATTAVNALLFARPSSPVWFGVANMTALLAGAIVGGILRVSNLRRVGD